LVVAGLTGGIATGKSTVAKIFEDAGAIIIDADKIARDVVGKGRPAYHEIVKQFGREVLLPDGEINRGYLADIIFNDSDKKKALNRIVHPFVLQAMAEKLEQLEKDTPDAVVILDVPLLIESGMHKDMSDVIVVYAPEHVQIKRLMARNNISETDALSRISSQMPIEEKKNLASILIDNSDTKERTRERTLEVYKCLRGKTG
jgi:dephospho-CoA kinase